MRILQILHDRERGGVQTLAEILEDGLRPHGFVFETAYLFPRPGLSTLAKLRHVAVMAKRIWRGGFDGLIAYQATASILVGAIGWITGCRTRIVHQTCTPGATALPVRLADKLVGTIGLYTANIANTVATRAEFSRYPAAYREALSLIEHGLDPPVPARAADDTRRRFALPQDAPLLLNVGRLVPQKNQDVLIRALARVPGARLAVAGGGANAEAYRALAASLGIADRLHLLGAVTSQDIADLYAAADLFVFPSTWETFGLAAVEAAMVGTPMVVADLAVLREVLSTEVAYPLTFVDPHDVDGWARAIRAALEGLPARDLRAQFARAIAFKYSRRRMIEGYVRLLRPDISDPAWTGLAEEAST
jgi:glycosyltransferase involved in cell wall biosynthesis